MGFEAVCKKIESGNITYRFGYTTQTGVDTLEAIVQGLAMPVAFIWYRWDSGSSLAICYIWVHEDVRRHGMATKIFNKLIESFGAKTIRQVTTGQVNELSRAWCIRNGFKYDKKWNYWCKDMAQKRPPRAKAN